MSMTDTRAAGSTECADDFLADAHNQSYICHIDSLHQIWCPRQMVLKNTGI